MNWQFSKFNHNFTIGLRNFSSRNFPKTKESMHINTYTLILITALVTIAPTGDNSNPIC